MDETFTKISERCPSLLFNDCVDLFNCIRFAQSLGFSGQQLILKLDIIKCRLARWGTRGDGEQSFEACLKEDDLDTMRDILQGMVMAFQACYNRSRRQSRRLANNRQREDASMALDQLTQQLRDQLHTVTAERLSGANLIDKTSWAIYNKDHAEILIRDCVAYIDELENDIQVGTGDLKDEAAKDIKEFNDIASLHRLKSAAYDVDPVMNIVAGAKYESLRQNGDIHIGRGLGWNRPSSQLCSGNNIVGSVGPGFRGKIHVGNTYGGKGFWDE
ncbi:hypothetical protein FOYG_17507 [Fusarium oxysporum NRRL 32931]|uniref:Prion-inhibition and propagation HeLo domain-containing protein n=2 Tax=Fusarium oxysporum TaxID=5507 RepID=W9HE89_FUSOX|nr:hypothetical protein FOYG_17507 [Fusarium oxysporum NRRL 32931]KAF5268035.1 hypothetical protein FOXYS1_1080 [Fusarium oxysporum]